MPERPPRPLASARIATGSRRRVLAGERELRDGIHGRRVELRERGHASRALPDDGDDLAERLSLIDADERGDLRRRSETIVTVTGRAVLEIQGLAALRARRRSPRARNRGHRKGREHRQDRRRKDIRVRLVAGRAHPYRRNRRGCAVKGGPDEKNHARARDGERRRSRPRHRWHSTRRPRQRQPRQAAPGAKAAPKAEVAQAPATSAPAATAAAVAAAAAPAAAAPVPNKGDVAWMLVCTTLVLMMSIPALALFYGGMVRSKNMLSVLMQVFVVFSLITVLWCVYGYSLAFTEGNAFFGSFDRLFLKGTFDSAKSEFSMAATFSKGHAAARARVRRIPGDVRGDHRLPDPRCVRRTRALLGGAAVCGALVHVLVPARSRTWCGSGPARTRTRARVSSTR